MRCFTRHRRRSIRRFFVIAVSFLLVDVLWMLLDGLKTSQSNVSHSQRIFANQEENTIKNRCSWPIKLSERRHSDIYTYDLPEITDYSMYENNKEYVIPVKSESVAYGPDLRDLEVIIVPFSHADPGYGNTMEDYFAMAVRGTLDSMVKALTKHSNLTFQWAETVFLERWWKDLGSDTKAQVKELIRKGQFEVVLGGWVMPDEASTHYFSVVDQLIEGHQWLIEHLGVKPKNSWSNDPFGYSSTMPYLWKQTGMENMLILRIHQAIKGTLMKKRSLEFKWQQYWSSEERNSILCNLMPYRGYWIGDVCGPYKQHICREYAFHRTEPIHKVVFVTADNLAERARVLYEQYRVTDELYQYDTLYMGLGEDFSFNSVDEWERIYANFQQIMNYINNKKEWKMNVRFGTLDDYFRSVRRKQSELKRSSGGSDFPTLSGDFFPYSDFQNDYWTGYYTTRPFNKRTSREVQSLIRGADIFNVYATVYCKVWNVSYPVSNKVNALLQEARRNLGMFQHHDGITGTSVPYVVQDFEQRLDKAFKNARMAYSILVTGLLSRCRIWTDNHLQEESSRRDAISITKKSVLALGSKDTRLIVVNPLERHRHEVIQVFVSSRDVYVTDRDGTDISVQNDITDSDKKYFSLAFTVDIPAFGIQTYTIKRVQVAVGQTESRVVSAYTLENNYLRCDFNSSTGMLVKMTLKGHAPSSVNAEYLAYTALRSGAYIFSPDGPAKPIPHLTSFKPKVTTVVGEAFSEITVSYPDLKQTSRLYHVTGVQGQGLHIQVEFQLDRKMTNREMIFRFKTDVKNGDLFFTDQNSFQTMGRKNYPSRDVESNYYPITSMAILESDQKRLTLHTQQPHGAASLQEGWLEVMLDRNVLRDDYKGLGQGVTDNKLTVNNFVLQLEYKDTPSPPREERYTYPTLLETAINEQLQNPLHLLIYPFPVSSVDLNTELLPSLHPMKTELPCDVSITGMRNLVKSDMAYNGTSLVLHRKSMHCGYPPAVASCDSNDLKTSIDTLFSGSTVEEIKETTLSHLYDKGRMHMSSDLTPKENELRAFKIIV